MTRFMLLLALACSSPGAGNASKTGECVRAADGSCKDGDDATLLQSRTYLDEEATDLLQTAESDEHQAAGARWLDLRGKVASQSSTGWSAPASLAIDGNRANYFGQGSCSHTYLAPNNWWEVDLGSDYAITYVKVTNRAHHGHHLNGFSVDVDGHECASNVQINNGEIKELSCYATGRYVKVRQPRNDYLCLCEFQVYGNEAPGVLSKQVSTSPSRVTFSSAKLKEGVKAWKDRDYKYTGIPADLLGATLLQGPHKAIPKGTTVTLQLDVSSLVCVWFESDNAASWKIMGGFARAGGFDTSLPGTTLIANAETTAPSADGWKRFGSITYGGTKGMPIYCKNGLSGTVSLPATTTAETVMGISVQASLQLVSPGECMAVTGDSGTPPTVTDPKDFSVRRRTVQGLYYNSFDGLWCRDDGLMVAKYENSMYSYCPAKACKQLPDCIGNGHMTDQTIAGQSYARDEFSRHKGNTKDGKHCTRVNPRGDTIQSWDLCDGYPEEKRGINNWKNYPYPSLAYTCSGVQDCKYYAKQSTCPTFRCGWNPETKQCVTFADNDRVEVRNNPSEPWKRGTVKGTSPMMVSLDGQHSSFARMWKEIRRLKKTYLECLAEKECWTQFFATSEEAKKCIACTDPNVPVAKKCHSYRECVRSGRSVLSDKSAALLRNIEIAAGLEKLSSKPGFVVSLDETGSSGGSCVDPTDREALKKLTEDCDCLTKLHSKCDGDDDQQKCILKSSCADHRLCQSWKDKNCKGVLAEVKENGTNLVQESTADNDVGSSMDETLTTKKTC